MIRGTNITATIVAIGLAFAPAAAESSVDEVIAKHIEAKGGQERWEAIRSMRVTGTFTAFSKSSPFELYRERDDRFHIDHTMNERRVVIGHDGDVLWWENEFFGEGAKKVEGADLAALSREVDFATPFFDIERRGHRIELIGETEYEGIPAIGIELTRADGTSETWYLDPTSYLEVARVSPGSDFGRPMEQRTFFDDFREVDGVNVPHYTETQWYTRDRVMRIDTIETNVEVDGALFRMPAPPGMDRILSMGGSWSVAVFRRGSPQAEFQESARDGNVEVLMGRALLREEFVSGDGQEVVRTLSFDRYADTYRMTEFSTGTQYMDVLEGSFDDDGKLVVSNVDTGTSFESFGRSVSSRVTFVDVADSGFEVHTEVSVGGEEANWFTVMKEVYTRSGE